MNRELKRNAIISIIIHATVLLFFILHSFISCRRINTRDISPFIDLQMGAGAPRGGGASAEAAASQDDAFPRPARRENKGKVEVSKKLVKRQLKTVPAVPKKQLTENEIKRMLGEGISPSPSVGPATGAGAGGGGAPHPYAWYLNQVRAAMYEAWQQPSSLIGKKGLVATVQIRVQRDGQITKKEISGSSGNAQMDESVRRALEAVSRLPELPPGFGGLYKDLTVDFELTEMALPSIE